MRILKDLLACLFPQRDIAEETRVRWASDRAMTRAASPREMRELLAACKDDYSKAERLLRLWDSMMLTGLVDSVTAWRAVFEALRVRG
mgnify:FL=1